MLQQVRQTPPQNAAIHWDGKLTTDRLGNKFEALAVVASGSPNYIHGKLLGVQQIENASGKKQAEATYEMTELWGLQDCVKALVFDTTASNSGWRNSAAKCLEEKFGHKLFYCACRHHVFERVISGVWGALFGTVTTGPDNPHFKALKQSWSLLDKTQDSNQICFSQDWLVKRKSSVTCELQNLLTKPVTSSQEPIRADYKECAENALAILGNQSENYHCRKPGATHSARWMGQLLYTQKMFMWSAQMEYNQDDIIKLKRMNQFTALFFCSLWLKASIGADAPHNDLKFIHDMMDFRDVDEAVASAALRKMQNHRWYLTEELVVFVLLSDNSAVTDDMKRNMADKLLSIEKPKSFELGKPIFKSINRDTTLIDLVGPNSWLLFSSLCINNDWLSESVPNWNEKPDFLLAKSFVQTVKVVNDPAERAIKLNTECCLVITDNVKQRSHLMQAIEDHRKKFPDFKKITLGKQ